MCRTQYNQLSPKAKSTRRNLDFCGIVFDMFKYVDVNDAVEFTSRGQFCYRAGNDVCCRKLIFTLSVSKHRRHVHIGFETNPLLRPFVEIRRVGTNACPDLEDTRPNMRSY